MDWSAWPIYTPYMTYSQTYIQTSAVKRLIASKIKVFVYIIYVCVLCIFIMYIYIFEKFLSSSLSIIFLILMRWLVPRAVFPPPWLRLCFVYLTPLSQWRHGETRHVFLVRFQVMCWCFGIGPRQWCNLSVPFVFGSLCVLCGVMWV